MGRLPSIATIPFLAGLVTGLALPASAQDTTGVINDVIAYDGVLEQDGVPVENDLPMRFIIEDTEGTELWRSERSAEAASDCPEPCGVSFYRGRFAVHLGEYAPIPDAVWDEERVSLRIELFETGTGWVGLQGAQTIEPVPYALWSLEANDIHAERLVNSIGGITVSGDASAGSVSVGGSLSTATGALSGGETFVEGAVDATTTASMSSLRASASLTLDASPLRMTNGTDTGVALSHDTGNVLRVNPDNAFATVTITEPYVSGTSTIDGDITIDSGGVRLGNAGAHRIEADRALFLMRQVTGNDVNTHISASDYHCWIGGWVMFGADINESATGDPMWAYTEVVSGEWYARGGIVSHSDEHETVDMLVVCMQTSAMTTGTWF